MKQKKVFDSMGLPPFDGKFQFTLKECDLLRMSLKVCYTHFKTLSDFYEPSNSYLSRVNDEILESVKKLYWKIYYGDKSVSKQEK